MKIYSTPIHSFQACTISGTFILIVREASHLVQLTETIGSLPSDRWVFLPLAWFQLFTRASCKLGWFGQSIHCAALIHEWLCHYISLANHHLYHGV